MNFAITIDNEIVFESHAEEGDYKEYGRIIHAASMHLNDLNKLYRNLYNTHKKNSLIDMGSTIDCKDFPTVHDALVTVRHLIDANGANAEYLLTGWNGVEVVDTLKNHHDRLLRIEDGSNVIQMPTFL